MYQGLPLTSASVPSLILTAFLFFLVSVFSSSVSLSVLPDRKKKNIQALAHTLKVFFFHRKEEERNSTEWLACLVFISSPVDIESWLCLFNVLGLQHGKKMFVYAWLKECHHSLHSWADKTCTHGNHCRLKMRAKYKNMSNTTETQWATSSLQTYYSHP